MLSLNILKNNSQSRGVLTEIGNDSAGASQDLAGLTLAVDLAETAPFTQSLSLGDLDQRNLTLLAEGLNITANTRNSPQSDECKKTHRNPQQGSKSGPHCGPGP